MLSIKPEKTMILILFLVYKYKYKYKYKSSVDKYITI